jgi:cytochrome c oxidase subunit III
MSALSPPTGAKHPKSGDGRGGVYPPEPGGGGGDNQPGDGLPDFQKRLERARLALIFGLAAVSMIFVAVTTAFFVRQASVVLDSHTHTYVRVWAPVQLPVRRLLWNTLVLLCSSVAMEMAHRSIVDEMILAPVRAIVGDTSDRHLRLPWLAITAFLGSAFLFGQWMAWIQFRAHGFSVSTAGPSPFFYLLTATHALHLILGIGILLYAVTISVLHQPIEHKRIVVEVARWYWHFMGVLWIYIFALLWFGQ